MRRYEYIVKESVIVCDSILYLTLVPRNGSRILKFRPGQYGLLSFVRGNILSSERPFSFMSSPSCTVELKFGIKIMGNFTNAFIGLKTGDSVFVRGPYGSFVFNEKKHPEAVFLAAGIGITPFLSAVRYATDLHLNNKIHLFYSNRTFNQVPFYNEICKLSESNANLDVIFTLTGEQQSYERFIKGRINLEVLRNKLDGDLISKDYFICGPQAFNDTMIDMLKSIGVPDNQIHIEGFALAPSSFFEKGTWAFPTAVAASTLMMIFGLHTVVEYELSKTLIDKQNAQIEYQQLVSTMNDINNEIDREANIVVEQRAAEAALEQSATSNEVNIVTPPVYSTNVIESTPSSESVIVTPPPVVTTVQPVVEPPVQTTKPKTTKPRTRAS